MSADMRKALVMIVIFLCGSGFAHAGNEKVKNFRQARKLAEKIHAEQPFTLYCGCRYEGRKVNFESCGYKPRKNRKSAADLNWEHVVPAENFGRSFVEWREGTPACRRNGRAYKGRKCAGKNPLFNFMEADLYNLWPEIKELNGLRSNYNMAALGGAAKNPAASSFGGCQAVLQQKKFEPIDKAKGIVARTYFYMHAAYPGRGIVGDKNEKLFKAWDKQFPVTDWECRRAKKIRAVQGNENTILQNRCAAFNSGD